jgi:hypothetical protein
MVFVPIYTKRYRIGDIIHINSQNTTTIYFCTVMYNKTLQRHVSALLLGHHQVVI